MSTNSQTPTFQIPRSDEIRSVAQQRKDTLPNIPDSLCDLANEIFHLQLTLDEKCREYDLNWLTAKQHLFELSSSETKRLKALEKEQKHKKERERLGKKLRGYQKKQFKETGKLPDEIFSELIQGMKEFLAKQNQK